MCKKATSLNFHLTITIDLAEVIYYLKQVFHLLYDKSVAPAEVLPYFSLIIIIIIMGIIL